MMHKILRKKFIDFFTSAPRNHKEIPSAPLVPENDPTVLFITAGMHPLVPYLMGEPHPLGKRLVDIQKSMRTDDIEEIGDLWHFSFFEMLGNWSLGDYFKKEAIEWSFEFLTDKKWLGFDPKKIYVSVFEGDADAPQDQESINVWKEVYKKASITAEVGERIFLYPKAKNWWGPAGTTGPCGPDSEMFYDTGLPLHDEKVYGPVCHINCNCGRYLEVWNDVFMEFNKKTDGTYEKLAQQNVDTGMGMERVVALLEWLNGEISYPDPFQTSLFRNAVTILQQITNKHYQDINKKPMRIILDHARAATFIIADGVSPSNKERGYVLRKLIRRAIRYGHDLGIRSQFLAGLANEFIRDYKEIYPELAKEEGRIKKEIKVEEDKFTKSLERGLAEISKHDKLTGKIAFDLYQSFGFPPELTAEIAKEHAQTIDKKQFEQEFKKHQELSRSATKGVFKGGLQDHSETTTRLHTTTHLLQQALRNVLGNHVRQKGSHITAQRLRFDFTHQEKLTKEQIQKVEDLVNQIIKKNLPVYMKIMPIEKAISQGALTVPGTKYPLQVKVYCVENFSKEVCAGPHVDFTGKLGKIKIIKEEAVSTDVRRIYAILEYLNVTAYQSSPQKGS